MLLQNRNGDLRINILDPARHAVEPELRHPGRATVHVGNAGNPRDVPRMVLHDLSMGHGGTDCRAGMIKEKCEMQMG